MIYDFEFFFTTVNYIQQINTRSIKEHLWKEKPAFDMISFQVRRASSVKQFIAPPFFLF